MATSKDSKSENSRHSDRVARQSAKSDKELTARRTKDRQNMRTKSTQTSRILSENIGRLLSVFNQIKIQNL